MTFPICRFCTSRTSATSGICGICRMQTIDRGLPEGKWVGGLVKKFVPARPVWTPSTTPLGHSCRCGCLLVHRDESCPACLVRFKKKAAEPSVRRAA